MACICGVRSTNDNVSRYLVSCDYSIGIGDLVSFETSDGEEIARVEHITLLPDEWLELLNYISEKVYPVIEHWLLYIREGSNAGTP